MIELGDVIVEFDMLSVSFELLISSEEDVEQIRRRHESRSTVFIFKNGLRKSRKLIDFLI